MALQVAMGIHSAQVDVASFAREFIGTKTAVSVGWNDEIVSDSVNTPVSSRLGSPILRPSSMDLHII
ncbi:hypothetical protein Taro_044678 [Colocasia esculenta]|uniref:Uncharacterized protein n=1 Tax=Colocasia esculenta TaxID=4460 RepID=A0A843WPB4_COLES|nr:hypothetical protein [Colocasia esculenta]